MISVNEALDIINKKIAALPPRNRPLIEASGCVLAEDIYAPVAVPGFDQSAMDGYAFYFNDYLPGKTLLIAGEVAAGDSTAATAGAGRALRIFTGAPVPDGADTVVVQEKTIVAGAGLQIDDDSIKAGANIRRKGSEIDRGALALPSGTLLTPAAIAFLAGMGITDALVVPRPVVSIIVTGKELKEPGESLDHGQVYESNSYSLRAALLHRRINDIRLHYCGDDPALLRNLLEQALQQSDLVLITGGISVGDYDFTFAATKACGVQPLFYKVKQKPGKPLYLGLRDHTIVFGLPGNPASVLTCFYAYVARAIDRLEGKTTTEFPARAKLAQPLNKKTGLTLFLKGYYDGEFAEVLEGQESYRLKSFAIANCLVKIDAPEKDYKSGDRVELIFL